MSQAPKFYCEGCKRSYVWKAELAGKRAKCKGCGQVMTIPAQPWQPEPEPAAEDDLYSLAEPEPPRQVPIKAPPLAMAAVAAAPARGGAAPLNYQREPT